MLGHTRNRKYNHPDSFIFNLLISLYKMYQKFNIKQNITDTLLRRLHPETLGLN